MKSLRLGLSLTGGTRFTPAALFTGANGGWWDPSDLSTMFQDSAGTTPVTANNDPVGKILDKSGNGNHLTQATAGKRPLYKTSGGLSWLEFDGVDDFLSIASMTVTDGSGLHSAGAAWYANAVAAVQSILNADGVARIAQVIRLNTTTPECTAFNTTPAGFTDTCAAVAATTLTVLTEINAATTVEIFKDGSGNGSTAVTGTRKTGAGQYWMGSFDGVSWSFAGRIYGAVHLARQMTAAEHAKLVTYLGSKQGRTI